MLESLFNYLNELLDKMIKTLLNDNLIQILDKGLFNT